MSSQSGSEQNRPKPKSLKKQKAQPSIPQKRSRRSIRKNPQINNNDESQNILPQNIPISEGEQIIVYHSYELQTTKEILQIPMNVFKSNKMMKIIQSRVGQIILQIKLVSNQNEELITFAKIKNQPHSTNTKPHSNQEDANFKKQPKQANETKKANEKEKAHDKDEQNEQNQSEQEQNGEQMGFLVWGKVCWVSSYDVSSKIIKQSLKIINTEQDIQILKIKTKEVNSDVFLILNIKKKIQAVHDHNGLINQGNTCYMNSYLQMLSHISQFKNLVFEASIVDQTKFPATLQLLFHKIDNEQKPVSAEQLVKSFGWSRKEVNIQQDAQQFSCLFYQVLERKLQEACPNPEHMSMSEMFEGTLLNMIQCLEVSNVIE